MLAVEAALTAEGAGIRMRIDGHGTVLTCRLAAGPADLFAALRAVPQMLPGLRLLVPVLVRTGLRIDVRVGSVPVARAGYGVRQNAGGRLFSLPSVRLGA